MTLVINSAFPLDFPRAYGKPYLAADFRVQPEDFYVEEVLGFPLSGEGEHLCLFIEKQQHNTHWVTAELAKYAGISPRDIGVCGRKDRHAITRQWFSLYDPLNRAGRRQVDWQQFAMDGVKIILIERHSKKLRLGDHQYNRFVIRLRNVITYASGGEVSSLAESIKEKITAEIEQKLKNGVPNYFGEQRFGRGGNNLVMASDWFEKGVAPPRQQRSMILSAARAYLFNLVLAHRVRTNTWAQTIVGDIINHAQPTGPLWGRGRLSTTEDSLVIEQTVLADFSVWCERLEHQGLHQERRDLVLHCSNLSCSWQAHDLLLSFDLPSGTFATAVLAEVALLNLETAVESPKSTQAFGTPRKIEK
jgi:tRNA pseudouridine13 synthase